MKSKRKSFKRRCLRRGLIYFLLCSVILNTSLPGVMALEVADMVGSTGAVATQWGDHTIIDTQHGAIIDWNNFNTGATQSVTFNQYMGSVQSSASAVLNRVHSRNVPTMFNGVLSANGRVFVVNPAGVIFGAGAMVNVSQLVASGLNMSNDAFNDVLADEVNPMVFEGGYGAVKNYGSINADSVYLVGKKIANMGTISAPDGLVVMAAGENVYLAQDGSNVLVDVHESTTNPADNIVNEGTISVGRGKIVLAAGDAFSGAINNVDKLAASSPDTTSEEGTQASDDSNGEEDKSIAVACKPKPKPKPDPDPDPEPDDPEPDDPEPDDPVPDDPEPDDPEPDPGTISGLFVTAPIPDPVELEYSGCPALMKWTANELGLDQRMMQIWTTNAMASTQDIQPCNTCAKLRSVATVLNDAEGTHTAALAEVIGEYASRTAPPSPEEMTMIASAIVESGDDNSNYARARVYLDALSEYVRTLNTEMHFSAEESVLFAADRYIAPLAEESQNDAMVAFIAARLAEMGG